MSKTSAAPSILQPLSAADPLALLFNDWLGGLAPIERHTRPRPTGTPDAESEETRSLLLEATATLHSLHRALARAVTLLSQDAPLTKLAPLFRPTDRRISIGSRSAESFGPLLDYVALQDEIISRADFKRFLRYSSVHRSRLAEAAAEQPHLERTCGLFLAVFDAAEEAEQDYYFLKPDDHAGRAGLLESLQGIVALDCFQKAY